MLRRRKLREKEEEYESVLFPTDDKNDSDESSDEGGEDISLNLRRRTQDEDSEEGEAGSEDEDDVPEAVSFSSGREAALQEMKTALQLIGQNKQKVKDKRRQLNEQYKLQKQRKLNDIAKKKLSEDFFDDLPEAIPKANSMKRKAVNTDNGKQAKDSEDEESFADTEEDFDMNDDFIPLEERLGGVTVEKVKENEKKVMSSVEQARQFKQQRLYGGKIPRMTNDSLIAMKGKRRARHK